MTLSDLKAGKAVTLSDLKAGKAVTLSDLKPGDVVRIESIETADPAVQRLMVLGLVEGAELSFLRSSLGGDPLEFRIRGAAISLRRELARRFRVAPLESHGRAR